MSEVKKGKIPLVVAVDTGGTFTDVLLLDGGRLRSLKLASTPNDPSDAVLEGLRQVLEDAEREADGTFLLLHGSTVATNALLERKGARVKLVTNAGFEDILEIGRQNRPQLYALVGHRPPPLVDRDDRHGIQGRIGPDGEVIAALDPAELEALPELLAGAESVAVVLLHSYANPSHEESVADALAKLDVPLSVSVRLLPEYREYERTSTTVVNAYIAPRISAYLKRLAREAGAERVIVMGSNGGSLPVDRAAREPVHMVLSGPAGGVVGALAYGRRAGHERIITFDMGGTSTDVSLCPGAPLHTRELEIGGQPIAIPVIDIHTVGAGGGSLARIDPGGALRVGPESAGADPGPICYGKGGTGVTVTDAHVWLGRLPADAFLGGEQTLDRSAVEPHLRSIAERLGASLEVAAEGILEVANAAMERALRVISVERGHDPAEFTLVAFGGAGGLHAAHLAERLGTGRAMVPPRPGLLSAYGMLAADITREVSRTVLISTASADAEASIESVFAELEQAAVAALAEEGVPEDHLSLRKWVDARYERQSFELRVPGEDWAAKFHALHEKRYGYRRPATPVEAVTLRAIASAPGPPLELEHIPHTDSPPTVGHTRAYTEGEWTEVDRVWRSDLGRDQTLDGPALVLEYSSTTWIPRGWGLKVDEWGNLHLSAT
ncbi:MAG: hydantoinase/oxoprolinase family protein [Gemmatimonadetes bacterium]|nr:hydantoinase/oxoprolinase family protein [Gemmatimonadota bacterium]